VAELSVANQSGGNDDALRSYRAIPDEDRKRAKVFFDRGKTVAGTGNYEYAIEMYIQGLAVDPENVEAHQVLREISLKRKASGGKDMGMFDKMKLPKSKEEKQAMLNAEKLLAYSPGDTDRMLAVCQTAYKAGCYDTVLWMGPLLQRANSETKKPDFKTYIALRDIYNAIEEYKLATEACHLALMLRPQDMELQHEMKNLAAKQTMKGGNYGTAKSFRESMRDVEVQEKLMDDDKDVHGADALLKGIRDAEAYWKALPDDQARFGKYIDALRKTEKIEYENLGIELLDGMYQKSKQFKWRQRIGEIRMVQLGRQERSLRQAAEQKKNTPEYAELVQQLKEFRQAKAKVELDEFQLIYDHYPTDGNARFQVASRMFFLGQFQEAIPVLQQVRSDPKHRTTASIFLGQAFLSEGYAEEAVDTLKAVIEEYVAKGDDKSLEMYYWYARGLEEKKDVTLALKAYSQVAQWSFNYRDVQARIKKLRPSAGS